MPQAWRLPGENDRRRTIFAAALERPSSLDLLEHLRVQTRERHQRLDAGIDFGAGACTRERYVAFLRGILEAVSPLERALARWFAADGTPTRSECLRSDLAGLHAREKCIRVFTREPRTLAEAYGCAYVIEGSSLGGLVLAPRVEAALGPGTPTAYLRYRGAATAREWRGWLRRLHAFSAVARPEDIADACELACATFDAYTESLIASGALTEPAACRA